MKALDNISAVTGVAFPKQLEAYNPNHCALQSNRQREYEQESLLDL